MNEEIAKLLQDIQSSKNPNVGEFNDHLKTMQKLAMEKSIDIVCEQCQSNQFLSFFYLKKLNEFDSPNGKPSVFPLQAYKCADCSHVNDLFVKK